MKDFVSKHSFIKSNITFCGGSAVCIGFAERVKQDFSDKSDYNVMIDEHFMLANARKYCVNKS